MRSSKARMRACERCGADYLVSKGNKRFCSMECWGKTILRGPQHGGWKGGTFVSDHGYRFVLVPQEERAKHTCGLLRGRYIREHHQKAERALGRCLKKGEVVHHINGEKLDNRNSNLLVCDHRYHSGLHQRMGRLWMQERFGKAIA